MDKTSQAVSLRLGHVHLKVRSMSVSLPFYTEVLGLKVTERVGDSFVFLSYGTAHHDLALQELGEMAPRPLPYATGLYHVAFEVTSDRDFTQLLKRLEQHHIQAQLVDHGISWAAYFSDPDANGLEVYVDRRKSDDGVPYWEGRSRKLTL